MMRSSDHKKENKNIAELYESCGVSHNKSKKHKKKLKKVKRTAEIDHELPESALPKPLQNILFKRVSQALCENLDELSISETIESHGEDILRAAADFLDDELRHYKVNQFDDIQADLRDDVAAMVIHELQKQGKLPRRLDWNEHEHERMDVKDSIEMFLKQNFQDLVTMGDSRGEEKETISHEPPMDDLDFGEPSINRLDQ